MRFYFEVLLYESLFSIKNVFLSLAFIAVASIIMGAHAL